MYEWLRARPHVWLVALAAVIVAWRGLVYVQYPKDAFVFAHFFIALAGVYGGLCLTWESRVDLPRFAAALAGTAWCVGEARRVLRGDS